MLQKSFELDYASRMSFNVGSKSGKKGELATREEGIPAIVLITEDGQEWVCLECC